MRETGAITDKLAAEQVAGAVGSAAAPAAAVLGATQQPPQPAASSSQLAGEADAGPDKPKCFVILYTVSKKHNVGTLLRSCTAFGVTQVCLVGSRQFNTFGSHGSAEFVDLRHFPTVEACCSWLREEQGCRILGVEIDPSAVPVQSHPFTGNTAFMLGNEGQGLSAKQMRLCDGFIYIPQHGAGTASLNVTVAASIILHHYALWAGYEERGREGAKFVVGSRPQRTHARGVVPLTAEERAALRDARAAQQEEGSGWLEEAMGGAGGLDGLLESLGTAAGDDGAGDSSGDGGGSADGGGSSSGEAGRGDARQRALAGTAAV